MKVLSFLFFQFIAVSSVVGWFSIPRNPIFWRWIEKRSAPLPQPKPPQPKPPQPWVCFQSKLDGNHYVAVRENHDNDIECLGSKMSGHCYWSYTKSHCVDNVAKYSNVGVVCGDHHKSKYGHTGYEKKGHWCQVVSDQWYDIAPHADPWFCLQPAIDSFVAVRQNKDNHIECLGPKMSGHCYWSSTQNCCFRRVSKNNEVGVVCGDHHENIHGRTGYGTDGHWCQLKESTPPRRLGAKDFKISEKEDYFNPGEGLMNINSVRVTENSDDYSSNFSDIIGIIVYDFGSYSPRYGEKRGDIHLKRVSSLPNTGMTAHFRTVLDYFSNRFERNDVRSYSMVFGGFAIQNGRPVYNSGTFNVNGQTKDREREMSAAESRFLYKALDYWKNNKNAKKGIVMKVEDIYDKPAKIRKVIRHDEL